MFYENSPESVCNIELITGSMFSGKTEELIRRLKKAKISDLKTLVFKHFLEVRFSNNKIKSHNKISLPAELIKNPEEIIKKVNDEQVKGIDKAQSFNDGIVNVCVKHEKKIVAGQDMDYTGKPFSPVPKIMTIAENIIKLHAVCIKYGKLAHFTHRIVNCTELIVFGEKEKYEPLYKNCYLLVNSDNK